MVEVLAGVVSGNDAHEVGAEEVEEQVVPPALPEVELVLSHHELQHLPSDRHYPDKVPVAHHHVLQVPAQQVSHEVNVPDVDPNAIENVAGGAIWSEGLARLARLAHHVGFTQVTVEDAESAACLLSGE